MMPILYIDVGTTTPPADIMTNIAQEQQKSCYSSYEVKDAIIA